MSEYTPNFGFELIDFNLKPWSEKEYANWRALDRVLSTVSVVPNNKGLWQNSTAYAQSDYALDPQSFVFYQCLVAHTSPASGTFAAARLANPSYWGAVTQNTGALRYDIATALTSAQQLQARQNAGIVDETHQFAQSGWQKFPGGLILQWGLVPSTNATADVSVTFPIQFPTAFLFGTTVSDSPTASSQTYTSGLTSITTSSFTVLRRLTGSGSTQGLNHNVYWTAWGY